MLERALSSLFNQTPHAPRTFLSWTAADATAAAAIRAVVRTLISRGMPLDAHEQKGKQRLSQFEHFEVLTRRAGQVTGPEVQWVAFSDDDDISSEGRFALLASECARVHQMGGIEVPRVLQCTRKARAKHKLTTPAEDAEAVRQLLSGGFAALADSAAVEGRDKSAAAASDASRPAPEATSLECFDLVVRLEVLRDFFRTCSPTVIQHRFCDLAFVFLVREGTWGKPHAFAPPAQDASDFVYFYSRSQAEINARAGSTSGASTLLTVRSLEARLARQCTKAVERLLSHTGDIEVDMPTLRAYTAPHRAGTQPGKAGAVTTSACPMLHAENAEDLEALGMLEAASSEASGGNQVHARLLRLLAEVRQFMEAELVQLRAGKTNALLSSIADGVVQREVGVAFSRHEMHAAHLDKMEIKENRYHPYDAVETPSTACFRAWLAGLARGPILHAALCHLDFAFLYRDTGQDAPPPPSAPTAKTGDLDPALLIRLDGSLPPVEEGEAARVLDGMGNGGAGGTGAMRRQGGHVADANAASILALAVYYNAGRAGNPPPCEGILV